MSGTTDVIVAEAGLFRNYTVTPTSVTDLQTAITNALASATAAAASAASAETDAANATTAATNATNASTAAIAAVNAAAASAETSIASALSSVSADQAAALASANAAAASATAANTSATTAAAAVATSATNAANSASAAASSAAAAASSATTAASSATSSATQATAASGSASSASTYASNAATSAANAAASAVTAANALSYTTGRNYIQNARFNVQQRGQGPWTAPGSFTADRWALSCSGDTPTVSIQSLSDANRVTIGDEAARSILELSVTGGSGAGNYTQLYHSIENVTRLSNKTVTVSFWANAGAAFTLGVRLFQNFGSGGSPSTGVTVAAQTANVTTAFQRFSLTFNVPSTAGKTLGTNGDHSTQIYFGFSSGATNAATLGVGVQTGTVNIYGVQLEVGSTATALEVKNYDYDLRECQRFFFSSTQPILWGFNAWGAGAFNDIPVSFPTTMRAAPTVTIGGLSGNTNVSTLVVQSSSPTAADFRINTAAAGVASISMAGFTASAEI